MSINTDFFYLDNAVGEKQVSLTGRAPKHPLGRGRLGLVTFSHYNRHRRKKETLSEKNEKKLTDRINHPLIRDRSKDREPQPQGLNRIPSLEKQRRRG